MEKLDNYILTINEKYAKEGVDLGWDDTAYTDDPAILIKGVAFNRAKRRALDKQIKKEVFKDDVKMRIAAPVIVPGKIYRYSDEDGEYTVEFTLEEIDAIYMKKMEFLDNMKSKFNDDHDGEERINSFVYEIWRVGEDNKADRSYSEFGIETPPGSIFMVTQLRDRKQYDYLVENEKTGYSIEGYFGMKVEQFKKEKMNKKTQGISFTESGKPSAWIGLPVGKSVIAGTEYTVEEVVENEGEDNEYRYNVIVSMTPVSTDSATEETAMADDTEKKDEAKTDEVKAAADEKKEDVKEEEMADETADQADAKKEVKEEEMAEGDAPAEGEDKAQDSADYYSKEEIDALKEELIAMIAEVKALIPAEESTDDSEEAPEKQEMKSQDKLLFSLKGLKISDSEY